MNEFDATNPDIMDATNPEELDNLIFGSSDGVGNNNMGVPLDVMGINNPFLSMFLGDDLPIVSDIFKGGVIGFDDKMFEEYAGQKELEKDDIKLNNIIGNVNTVLPTSISQPIIAPYVEQSPYVVHQMNYGGGDFSENVVGNGVDSGMIDNIINVVLNKLQGSMSLNDNAPVTTINNIKNIMDDSIVKDPVKNINSDNIDDSKLEVAVAPFTVGSDVGINNIIKSDEPKIDSGHIGDANSMIPESIQSNYDVPSMVDDTEDNINSAMADIMPYIVGSDSEFVKGDGVFGDTDDFISSIIDGYLGMDKGNFDVSMGGGQNIIGTIPAIPVMAPINTGVFGQYAAEFGYGGDKSYDGLGAPLRRVKSAMYGDSDSGDELEEGYSPLGNNVFYKDSDLAPALNVVRQSPVGSSVLSEAGNAVSQDGDAVGIGIEEGYDATTGGVSRVEGSETGGGQKVDLRTIEINPQGSLIPGLNRKISNEFPGLDDNNKEELAKAYVLVHELAHHTSPQLESEDVAESKADQFLMDTGKSMPLNDKATDNVQPYIGGSKGNKQVKNYSGTSDTDREDYDIGDGILYGKDRKKINKLKNYIVINNNSDYNIGIESEYEPSHDNSDMDIKSLDGKKSDSKMSNDYYNNYADKVYGDGGRIINVVSPIAGVDNADIDMAGDSVESDYVDAGFDSVVGKEKQFDMEYISPIDMADGIDGIYDNMNVDKESNGVADRNANFKDKDVDGVVPEELKIEDVINDAGIGIEDMIGGKKRTFVNEALLEAGAGSGGTADAGGPSTAIEESAPVDATAPGGVGGADTGTSSGGFDTGATAAGGGGGGAVGTTAGGDTGDKEDKGSGKGLFGKGTNYDDIMKHLYPIIVKDAANLAADLLGKQMRDF